MARDPITYKPPVVALTEEEIDDMRQQIADGVLPPDAFQLYTEACERRVYGHDVQHDDAGNPIEQGVGSAAQPSRNSINAYKAHQMGNKFGPEPGFEEHVARMESELAAYEAKQREQRAATGKRGTA